MASNVDRRPSQATVEAEEEPRLDYADYTVAWITALPIEYAASYAVFARIHKPLPRLHNDSNFYTCGNIGDHNIVMVCSSYIGASTAGRVATHLDRSFPNIRLRFMVGVGGGAPTIIDNYDIRLGDVVVANKVMQFDQGKMLSDGKFERAVIQDYPDPILANAILDLDGRHMLHGNRMLDIAKEALELYPRLGDSHSTPSPQNDKLFKADYKHCNPNERHCENCSPQGVVDRPQRYTREPKVHRGAIASGNQFIGDAITRDTISKELNAICFDMEAAGLLREYQYLPIRGICNYADSHKNDRWKGHAALMASAYAKELLQRIDITQNNRI